MKKTSRPARIVRAWAIKSGKGEIDVVGLVVYRKKYDAQKARDFRRAYFDPNARLIRVEVREIQKKR